MPDEQHLYVLISQSSRRHETNSNYQDNVRIDYEKQQAKRRKMFLVAAHVADAENAGYIYVGDDESVDVFYASIKPKKTHVSIIWQILRSNSTRRP